MPRRNRPNRDRRVQTPKVARIDVLLMRALASIPAGPVGRRKEGAR